ncbi:MAG: hypothetical protein ACFWUM_10455 [Eubacteriales bacterium]|jgi:hypothetical protein
MIQNIEWCIQMKYLHCLMNDRGPSALLYGEAGTMQEKFKKTGDVERIFMEVTLRQKKEGMSVNRTFLLPFIFRYSSQAQDSHPGISPTIGKGSIPFLL